MVPGGAEADAAEAIGEGGRAAELLGEAGKLTDAADTATQGGAAGDPAKLGKDAGGVAADGAKTGGAIKDGKEVASTGAGAAKPIARREPYAFGAGPRSERAAAIIDRAAQALGRNDASSLVDTVVYDPAERTPSFWVDPDTGERTITINAATFGKTKAGQLITGTHELVHAEAWERALSEHAGDLATTHRQTFVPQLSLTYTIREIETERRALQSVKRLLGGLTPQQVGRSTRYIEEWQDVMVCLTGYRLP
jgi:hypothetical protein